ncbi:MAG TPA: hypothetical protein VIV11_26050 [Kofleriaceae bacterium]
MMTRLEFVRSLAQLGLAAAVLPACTKDGDGDPAPAPDAASNPLTPDAHMMTQADAGTDAAMNPPTCATTSAAIASNHGHALSVSIADVNAGVDKTYQIQGSSTHPHSVLITAASFATLKMMGTLSVMSSLDASHRHTVNVTCAA